MWAVTALVAELRGEPAPTTFFDARDIMAKSRAARSAERKSA
jgi:hypothetical protein